MREEPHPLAYCCSTPNADERRLISAIAARAGWSVVGAADEEARCRRCSRPAWPRSPRRTARQLERRARTCADRDACASSATNFRSSSSRHSDTVSIAVEAMRAGRTDFLVRPVAPERLLEALAANADRRKAAGELAPVSEKLAPELALEQLVGAAPEFRAALAVAAKAARNRLPILIVGEPGTGKETVARAIHAASLRAKGPLLSLDCKAIPANIIDSELFGHEKGAFPGAFAPKIGKLVQADGGTLLLDEIGALPAGNAGTAGSRPRDRRSPPGRPQRQPLGRCPRHRDEQPAAARRFPSGACRADRRDDRSSCRRCASAAATFPRLPGTCSPASSDQTGLRPLSIGNDALAVLMRYGWPGNVRQLAGVLFRAALQCDGQLADRRALPAHRRPVALLRPADRLRANTQQAAQRGRDRGSARRHPVHRAKAICGRSKRSRPTSSASRSATIAGA